MNDTDFYLSLPPVQGCLYCHSEGSTFLIEPRRILGFGSDIPFLKCSECGSTAQLDAYPDAPDDWQILYKKANHSLPYYYAALTFGQNKWHSAAEALEISRRIYARRRRMDQINQGELSWLLGTAPTSPPRAIGRSEPIYMTLKAVTYRKLSGSGFLAGPNEGTVIDSGKLYVTDQKLYVSGQRQDWSFQLSNIDEINYDFDGWYIVLRDTVETEQIFGTNTPGEPDAQLVASVIEVLRKKA